MKTIHYPNNGIYASLIAICQTLEESHDPFTVFFHFNNLPYGSFKKISFLILLLCKYVALASTVGHLYYLLSVYYYKASLLLIIVTAQK